jgi:hypothetical protein
VSDKFLASLGPVCACRIGPPSRPDPSIIHYKIMLLIISFQFYELRSFQNFIHASWFFLRARTPPPSPQKKFCSPGRPPVCVEGSVDTVLIEGCIFFVYRIFKWKGKYDDTYFSVLLLNDNFDEHNVSPLTPACSIYFPQHFGSCSKSEYSHNCSRFLVTCSRSVTNYFKVRKLNGFQWHEFHKVSFPSSTKTYCFLIRFKEYRWTDIRSHI